MLPTVLDHPPTRATRLSGTYHNLGSPTIGLIDSEPPRREENPLAGTTEFLIVAPILPGKLEAWRQMMREVTGPRYEDWADHHKRMGVSREVVWEQRFPDMDIAIVSIDGVRIAIHSTAGHLLPWSHGSRSRATCLVHVEVGWYQCVPAG